MFDDGEAAQAAGVHVEGQEEPLRPKTFGIVSHHRLHVLDAGHARRQQRIREVVSVSRFAEDVIRQIQHLTSNRGVSVDGEVGHAHERDVATGRRAERAKDAHASPVDPAAADEAEAVSSQRVVERLGRHDLAQHVRAAPYGGLDQPPKLRSQFGTEVRR